MSTATKPPKKRPLAPVIWFGTSLAAAAALTLVFLTPEPRPQTQDPTPRGAAFAQASYVEAGDRNATTMVFTDQQSGWLVVWATENSSAPNS